MGGHQPSFNQPWTSPWCTLSSAKTSHLSRARGAATGSARCAVPHVPAAVMPPRQPLPCRDEGLESSASGMALTNCLSPSPSPQLLSRLHTSVDASLFFPLIEEVVLTGDAQGRASRPLPLHLPKLLSSLLVPSSCWLAGGWSRAGYPPSPPAPYKHSFSALFQPAARDAAAQVVPRGSDELLDASVPSSQHVPRIGCASHRLPGEVRGFATPQCWEAEG